MATSAISRPVGKRISCKHFFESMKLILVAFVLLMLITITCAVGETLDVNGCNVTFDMKQPYEVTLPRSETFRNDTSVSEVDLISINSTHGVLIMTIIRSNLTTQLSWADSVKREEYPFWPKDTPVYTIEIDNSTGWYTIADIYGTPTYMVLYYVQNPSGADFFKAPTGTEMTISCMIASTLSLYDTADFLRRLNIEPQ